MAVLIIFGAFLGLACMVSLVDWRRAWLLAVLIGFLQDPVRKLTPGMPFYLMGSIVIVYFAIIFAVHRHLRDAASEFANRFSGLAVAFSVFFCFLLIAALNGIVTFGFALWEVPVLSLFIYLAPLPAVILGYLYVENEERLLGFLRFYSILTAIALIGGPLEYFRMNVPALGMVQQIGDYIRYLPGIQVRMISGFYRAPDMMAWHAAMLTSISIAMVVRAEMRKSSWPWMLAAGWAFYNCMLSGRRKAIYFVAVFAIAFMLRYFRKLKLAQVIALSLSALVIALVIHHLSSDEASSAYTRGAATTQEEMTQRFEGGVFETIQQAGYFGAGLGTATQGVQHFLGGKGFSWQEGGFAKLTIELGVPGLMAAALLGWVILKLLLVITRIPDHPTTSQISRVTLFALTMGNIANFIASAQTYSDPVITLISAFLLGSLFATVTLDERAASATSPQPERAPLVYAPQA
jgi:hypothetical protein